MGFLAVLANSRALEVTISDLLEAQHSLAQAHSWAGLERVVRERPVSTAVVDLDALPPYPSAERALASLRGKFPHLGLVLLIRYNQSPVSLVAVSESVVEVARISVAVFPGPWHSPARPGWLRWWSAGSARGSRLESFGWLTSLSSPCTSDGQPRTWPGG